MSNLPLDQRYGVAAVPSYGLPDDPNDAFAPTPSYRAMYEDWLLVNALWQGGSVVRGYGERFLPREQSESAEEYNLRLNRTTLVNYFSKIVETAVNKVFAKELLFKDTPADFDQWREDIDLQGRSIHVFAREVFLHGLLDGVSYILADAPTAPELGRFRTLADDQELGIRPYLTLVPAHKVIGWRTEIVRGKETLMQVRIREDRMVPDGRFGEKLEERVRVLEPGRWTLYRRDPDDRTRVATETGTTNLSYIPLAPFFTNRTGFMRARSPLLNIANLQLRLYHSYSDQSRILAFARLPIFHIGRKHSPDEEGYFETAGGEDKGIHQGIPAEWQGLSGYGGRKGNTIELGPNRSFETDVDDVVQWIEHEGKAIGAGRDDLNDIKKAMDELSFNLTLRAGAGDQTATEQSLKGAQAHASLQAFALNFQDSMELALAFMADLAGIGNPMQNGGQCIVSKDFGNVLSSTDFQYLQQAYKDRAITKKTLLTEMKRRGMVAEDFDVDAEVRETDNLEDQNTPALAGAVPGQQAPDFGGVREPVS